MQPDEQEESEVVAGLLPFTINGVAYKVPELKWKANRTWRERLQETFATLIGVPTDTPAGQDAMADAERKLVLAYDVTGALGDLEDATEREIDAIYNRLIEVAFPLAQSQTALMVGIVRAAAESARVNFTSGPSLTGASEVPTISKPRSPTARSSSSSRRRKSE